MTKTLESATNEWGESAKVVMEENNGSYVVRNYACEYCTFAKRFATLEEASKEFDKFAAIANSI